MDRMTPDEKARAKDYVRRLRDAKPLLEEIALQELRSADPRRSHEILEGTINWAVKNGAALPTSGLVEQQRIFSKGRRERSS